MTIRYKSETFDLTDTNITNILTCPSDATIIVKSLQASHKTASNVNVDAYIQKSGGSNVEISHVQLNKNFANVYTPYHEFEEMEQTRPARKILRLEKREMR